MSNSEPATINPSTTVRALAAGLRGVPGMTATPSPVSATATSSKIAAIACPGRAGVTNQTRSPAIHVLPAPINSFAAIPLENVSALWRGTQSLFVGKSSIWSVRLLGERLLERRRQLIEVGDCVAIAGEAEIDTAVVADHAD